MLHQHRVDALPEGGDRSGVKSYPRHKVQDAGYYETNEQDNDRKHSGHETELPSENPPNIAAAIAAMTVSRSGFGMLSGALNGDQMNLRLGAGLGEHR